MKLKWATFLSLHTCNGNVGHKGHLECELLFYSHTITE